MSSLIAAKFHSADLVMITCPECGAEVEAHRRRCAECGHALAASERKTAVIDEPEFLDEDAFLPNVFPGDTAAQVRPEIARQPAGVWRQGNLLVIRKGAELPPRCIKSNEPSETTLKRTMYWHHPAIYATILIGVLIYAIVAMVVQKKAVVQIGLTRKWLSRRRWAIAMGWLIALGGVGLFFVAAMVDDQNLTPFFIIAGIVCMLIIGPIYGVLRSRLVTPNRITDEYAWIKGAHPSYLAELREFPGEGEWA